MLRCRQLHSRARGKPAGVKWELCARGHCSGPSPSNHHTPHSTTQSPNQPTTHRAPPCCMQPFLSRRHFYAATTFHKCIILYKNIHEVFHNSLVHVSSRVVLSRETTNVAIIYMRALLCLTWMICLKSHSIFKIHKNTIFTFILFVFGFQLLYFLAGLLCNHGSKSVFLDFPIFWHKSFGLHPRDSIGTLQFTLSYLPCFFPSIDSLLDVYYLMP